MSLSQQNQAKLKKFKSLQFPSTTMFLVRVLKGIIDDDFNRYDNILKQVTCEMYEKNGMRMMTRLQAELQMKRDKSLALLNKIETLL